MEEKEYGLKLNINTSGNKYTTYYKQTEINKKYTLLIKEDSFLFLKKDHQSLAIGKNHGNIEGEDEFLIFEIKINEDNIELINFYDKNIFFKHKRKCYYNHILDKNYFNFKLYKKISINDKHELKINDIIRIGGIKLILKAFRLNGKNFNFIGDNVLSLKNEKNKICDYEKCDNKTNENSENNPIINFCCEEKYYHYECKKKSILNDIRNKEKNNNCIKYFIKTHCSECDKIYPLNFLYNNKIFELIDESKNIEGDYLLFESLDFKDKDVEYGKYIFYIILDKNKNKENIIIGNINNNNEFDKCINIDNKLIPNNEKAIIECDKLNNSLILKNISDSNDKNIFVLQDIIILKPEDDILCINFGNIQIEGKMISNKEFPEVEKEMKKNPEIEIRK